MSVLRKLYTLTVTTTLGAFLVGVSVIAVSISSTLWHLRIVDVNRILHLRGYLFAVITCMHIIAGVALNGLNQIIHGVHVVSVSYVVLAGQTII